MMRAGLLFMLLLAACEPLSGYTVEERTDPEVAVLPMRCLDSLARTSGGLWVCRTAEGLVASRGDALSFPVIGQSVAVGGAAVWTWVQPYPGAVIARFEDDPLTGGLRRSPDAGFDWYMLGSSRPPIRSVLAHERDLVLSAAGVQVLGARDGGFETLSTTAGTFLNNSPAEVFFQVNDVVWASGPGAQGPLICAFNFRSAVGITSSGQCSRLPPIRFGPGSGGLWVSAGGNEPVQFFKPTVGVQRHLELPRVAWSFGEVPWAIEDSSLLVPRVEGDRVIIERYQASEGNTWAGATEAWVYEVGTSTHVRAR
jgi:hypothetical protein